MRPRPALLLGALIAPALPLVAAAPAHAATTIICVNRPADETDCGLRPATIPLAIAAATDDPNDNVIRIGPGTYSDGPYVFDGTSSSLVVQGTNNGTGDNATILRGAAAAPYVTVTNATLRNLRITVSGAGRGLDVAGSPASVQNVIVADTPQAHATGAVGMKVTGGKVESSVVNLDRAANNTGIDAAGLTVLSRVTTRASDTGVLARGGEVDIDNSVLELGPAGATGLRAGTDGSGDVDVDAKHLTVVGGAAGSRGVWAYADTAAETSSITLDNSVVWGPAFSLAATASAGTADLDSRFSDFQTEQETGGSVDLVEGNVEDVPPGFIDEGGGNYAPRAGSLLVDKGSLLLTIGPDRDGLGRAVDGDGNGSPVPDMGAYELRDRTAPNTTFTGGPSGSTNDNTPVFAFRSEDGAKFECRLDAGAWQACASPATTPPLADGAHSFQVRATDEVLNVEPVPAVRAFTVDTVTPNARITKKPPKRFFKKRIKFKFATSEPGATLQCKLDRRAWRACRATYRFNVKVGKHVMLVRAVDKAGNVDPSPARYKYRRLKRR